MEKLNNNQITWLEIARREGWKRIERRDELIYLYGENQDIKINLNNNIVDLINLDDYKVYEIEDLCIFNEIEFIKYFVEIRDYKNKIIFRSYYNDTIKELIINILDNIDYFKKTLYIKKVIGYNDDNGMPKEYFKIIKKFDTIEDYKIFMEKCDL